MTTLVASNDVFIVLFNVVQADAWFGVGEYRLILHGVEKMGGHGEVTLQRKQRSPARDLVWSDANVTPQVVFVVVQALLKVLPEPSDMTVSGERPLVHTVNIGDLLVVRNA